MDATPSKRLRLRFFPEDDKALDDMLEATSHTSKSGVIRAALMLLDQVWNSKCSGFRIAYFRNDAVDRADVLDAAFIRPRKGKDESADSSGRSKTEKSIEIRLSRTDEERIERLLGMGAAQTFSEVVRRSIRLYASVVMRGKDGWELVTLSSSGDVLPMNVPGMGSEASPNAGKIAQRVESPRAVGFSVTTQPDTMVGALPKSLAADVRALAEREGCSAEMLLVDIVRSETIARLHGRVVPAPATQSFTAEANAPEEPLSETKNDDVEQISDVLEAPVEATQPQEHHEELVAVAQEKENTTDVAPIATSPTPESTPESTQAIEPAPTQALESVPAPAATPKPDADLAVIDELSRTLDQMADNIEKVMQLVGATRRSKDQQGQLTDLFLSNEDELDETEKLSPTERLFQRAQELNERLTALVALSQRERKPRKPKVAAQDSQQTDELQPEQPQAEE
jgi:Arc/MetJ-type ribon-helix-helix transcriptional regulator